MEQGTRQRKLQEQLLLVQKIYRLKHKRHNDSCKSTE